MMEMYELKNFITPVHDYLTPEHSLHQAIAIMYRTKWDTVPVMDASRRLLGVFTRSCLYQALLDRQSLDTKIGPLMKSDALCIGAYDSNREWESQIVNAEVGTGIVVNGEREVVGLLTKSDVISSLLHTTNVLKDQLEVILRTSELGVIVTNINHSVIFANQRLYTMLNITEEEILHRHITSLISPMHMQLLEKREHHMLRIGNSHVIAKLSKYISLNGKQGSIFLFREVSRVEKMAQELQNVVKWRSILQTVIMNAYDALIMTDEHRMITFVSPALLDIFEMQESEVLYKPIERVLPHLGLQYEYKSGKREYSDIREVKGIRYTVQRIPVYQNKERIGVIGKIIFRGLHEMKEAVRMLEKNESGAKAESIAKHETSKFTFDQILTQDPAMQKIIRSAMKSARCNATVLIRGESGTGKELFAHAIHSMSERSEAPFVTVNCAAIPEHLLESEFFGYEEGAFSGAKQRGNVGKFDLANGGTLFLDEVGDMSLQLQARMLRVIQEKAFYRIGGTERIQVNVRIIAATHHSLEDMLKKGRFREDLFYRLNVISFEIPPLRKRKKDMLLLFNHFMRELNRTNGTNVTGVDESAVSLLLEYDWPGNVREFKNFMERAMLFSEQGKIQIEDLPTCIASYVNHQ
jgi:transcriptional regulator with PAS, ATPase and Fis domain